MLLIYTLLIFSMPSLARMQCIFSVEECHCEKIHISNFLDDFHRGFYTRIELPYVKNFSINIEHFEGSHLEYIAKLPVKTTTLKIRNSGLETISPNTFEEFKDLEEVDFSGNLLNELTFFRTFGSNMVKRINLSRNRLRIIADIFLKFVHLYELDLSNNLIGVVNLNFIFGIQTINLCHNRISKLVPVDGGQKTIKNINLSENSLKEFNETELNCNFVNIDLSYNQLSTIKIIYNKTVLNLSGNYIEHIRDSGFYYPPYVNHLYLSSQGNELNQISWNIKILNSIKLNNNNISNLLNSCFNISSILFNRLSLYSEIDISNSSITDIQNSYFSSLNVKTLNISSNIILNLGKSVFANSRINNLDLSNNRIKFIEMNAFKNSTIINLNMSHNQIESITYVFDNILFLNVLDLSFNKLYILEENTFLNQAIKTLLLDNNHISYIRKGAFKGLMRIEQISLSNNDIRYIESNAFSQLPQLKLIDLRNNIIEIIQNKFVYFTPNLSEILFTGNNISYVHPINHIQLKSLIISTNGNLESRRLMNIHLSYLSIENSNIVSLKRGCFYGLFNLVSLRFNNSIIKRIHDGSLDNLYGLEYLDTQNLFKHIHHLGRNLFKDLISLKTMDLSSLSLNAIDPDAFVGLKKLKSLIINRNSIRILKRNTFFNLNLLEILDLSFNEIQEIENMALNGLYNLKEIHLNHNNIPSLVGEVLFPLGNLEELHLDHNNLGELSTGIFQNLTKLKLLNLSYNNLNSLKIGIFSNMNNLKVLDLSNNYLETIESESVFFNLINLDTLYLNYNRLKTLNFETLIRFLPSLQHIGVSFNNWYCSNLISITASSRENLISYHPSITSYNEANIDGIRCEQVCIPTLSKC